MNVKNNARPPHPPHVVVSVIIATRNDAARIGMAIISVLQQTFRDLELIVINDASTDITANILQIYRHVDSRIRVITNPTQLGRAGARNEGLSVAAGEFVAILDSDDIMLPDRLARQIDFMRQNPSVGILGSGAIFEFDGSFRVAQPPCGSLAIRTLLSSGQNNAIINSSMLARKFLLFDSGGYQFSKYSPNYNEDYITFKNLVSKADFANVPAPLILVCPNGLLNPKIMKAKLREMHAYECSTFQENMSYARLKRLIVRRLSLLIPDHVLMFLYRRRILSLQPYIPVEFIQTLKKQIIERQSIIEGVR